MSAITSGQLKRLQTLYGQLARHHIDAGPLDAEGPRARRLLWAAAKVGREVTSFSDLTQDEAKSLIDGLQAELGVKHPPRRRMSREKARRHGIDGRRDGQEFASSPQLAEAAEIEAINELYTRLGWSRERFDAWLRSSRSPLGRKSSPQVRTKAQANRVRWALERMLKKKGLWKEKVHG